MKQQLSQIIAAKIYNELTSHMEYKSTKKKYQRERSAKAKQNSIQFTQQTVNHLNNILNLKPEQNKEDQIIKFDEVHNKKQHGLYKRASMKKIRRSIIIQKKLSILNSRRKSTRKINRSIKQNHKGLIKLNTQQEESPSLLQHIEKLRQKKIKYASVLQQLSQSSKINSKKFKSTIREFQNNSCYSTERMFITTFNGQIVKQDKKQQNNRKDEIYTEKIKIKPLFKLKQNISSRKDAFRVGQMATQTRRNSIQDCKDSGSVKNDNYYIKSIIDVISTRKNMDNSRRRRNIM